MKKRIISLLIMSALALSITAGCSSEKDAQQAGADTASQKSEASQTGESDQSDEKSQEDDSTKITTSGISMSVDDSDGKLSISRAERKSTPMGESDTWTVFVYLCGTNLESTGQGSATSDIAQILDANPSDNVRFVFQTGGTEQWTNEVFDAKKAERYVIENGDITLADSVPLSNMGDSDTLKDFLSWGVSKYPAEKMGVIFWDHGSGSINGVCFDELNEDDSLTLSEMNTALSDVYADMTDQFEFIGFDACLMGTVETANIMSTYARYMYGSQETEPGTGWDYTSIANILAEKPESDGAQLGKNVADSFYDECKLTESENRCTMTIIDLQKIDDFIVSFNDFSRELYNASLDNKKLNSIVRGINSADNFGGNNKTEGYTNMVDVGGILSSCSDIADSSKALSDLKNCISYNKNGSDHSDASGLSVYYPLQVSDSEELGIFSEVSVSPYYLSIVDMVANGYSADEYDNSVFFGDDGCWVCNNCQYDDFDYTYFNYADETESQDSSLITFSQAATVDDEGTYYFILDDDGLMYTSSVTGFLYMNLEDSIVLLGESNDIYADWSTGSFADNFDGLWLSLPNGQLLPTYVVDITANYVIYTSPVYLNGERTNLRLRQNEDGIIIEGAWDGISEDSAAARGIRKLKAGDKIEVIYYLDDDSELTAEAYEWKADDTLAYSYLPESDYYYSFCIEDIYGDYYFTDPVMFSIDEEGSIFFSELS